eukprot:676478-Amphidinium_carterae.1
MRVDSFDLLASVAVRCSSACHCHESRVVSGHVPHNSRNTVVASYRSPCLQPCVARVVLDKGRAVVMDK